MQQLFLTGKAVFQSFVATQKDLSLEGNKKYGDYLCFNQEEENDSLQFLQGQDLQLNLLKTERKIYA